MTAHSPVDILPFEPGRARAVIALILSIQRREIGIPITEEDQPDLADILEFTREGPAKALLTALVDWAGEKEIREIFLCTTPKFLAAHRFYPKNGFEEIGEGELPEAFPVMAVDKGFYRYRI